jgi:hypothetical protein
MHLSLYTQGQEAGAFVAGYGCSSPLKTAAYMPYIALSARRSAALAKYLLSSVSSCEALEELVSFYGEIKIVETYPPRPGMPAPIPPGAVGI